MNLFFIPLYLFFKPAARPARSCAARGRDIEAEARCLLDLSQNCLKKFNF
jgi:hypothetical protein